LYGRSGSRIDAIGMTCADLDRWLDGSSATHDLPRSGGTGGSPFRATCPRGYVLSEIHGRAGDRVDAISGTCRHVVR
jgi:hypothetical protein